MKKQLATTKGPVALLTALLVSASFPVTAADNIVDAFKESKFGYSFRWRLENVDQDPLPKNGTAIPLRARINLHTADLHGLSFKVEFDYVFNFGVDSFRAGAGNTPNPIGYPIIPDPGGEDLNQIFLQYKAKFGSQFRLGRQRIIYDNARFIGNVGWRQNEQTYDSFSFGHKTDNGWDLKYTYVDKVNTIFGNDVPAGDRDQNTNLFNVSFANTELGKMTGYYYDIDDKDVAGFSNTTWGLRINGKLNEDGPVVGYGLEYAYQKDNADNPIPYSAKYWRGDLSVGFNMATIYIGYESLDGDKSLPGQAFRTPLATLHAFNGWADKFLKTPDAGLTDTFFGAKGKLGNWKWNLLHHSFHAESGSGSYGNEVDGSIARKFKDNYSILFKAATFNSNDIRYGDTIKFWVQLTADF